jgi:hypothetical protein
MNTIRRWSKKKNIIPVLICLIFIISGIIINFTIPGAGDGYMYCGGVTLLGYALQIIYVKLRTRINN